MRGPSRTRRVLKWIATVISIVLLVEGFLSYWVAPKLRTSMGFFARGTQRSAPRKGVSLPTYLFIFAGVAIPTILLWWRDRPFPAGHCQQCGYDLTGNVSGRCPECGTAVGDDKAADANG